MTTATDCQNVFCPHCGSSQVTFKVKVGCWECQACENRFDDPSPTTLRRRIDECAARPKDIFFSYGHDGNVELVQRFKADLETRGHRVWFDEKEIGTWDDWRGKIVSGIDKSHMAIAFISKHAIRDPGVCRNEIAIALNRFGIVYPVLLEVGIESDIPITIAHLQWPDLSQWRAIRDGQLPGTDWQRWYEEKLLNLIEKLESEATRFADESRVLRLSLAPASFESRITQHVPGFIGREWLFDAYHHWLNTQPESRLFWIKAGPGVGKSAIAANLTHRQRGSIVASWFCDARSSELRSANAFLRTLAFQLALRWEDYRVCLLRRIGLGPGATDDMCKDARKELDKMDTEDLFHHLLAEPMTGLIWREHKLVAVIDALDEATDKRGNNAIADFIGQQLSRLPDWFAVVVTSRPEADISSRLAGYKPFEMDAHDARNLTDLRIWLQDHLFRRQEFVGLSIEKIRSLEELLLERSAGMMLYLKMVEEGLKEGSLAVAQLATVESGLPGLYRRYYESFHRRFGDDFETTAKPLLRLLLAAGGPLPEDLACAVLGWNSEQFLACRNRLGSYLLDTLDGHKLFHKTLDEWLTTKDSGPFFLDRALGQQPLADVLFADIGTRVVHEIRWHYAIVEWLPEWLPQLAQYDDADSCNTLGVFLSNSGQLAKAIGPMERSVALRRATPTSSSLSPVANLFDQVPSTNQGLDLEQSLNNLARLLIDLGRFEDAEPLLGEAHEILKGAILPFEEFSFRVSLSASARASLLKKLGRFDEAESLYREALRDRMLSLPKGHPGIAPDVNNLGTLLMATGRYAEAEPLLRAALAMRKFALPAGDPEIAQSLNNLAVLFGKTDRFEEAEQLVRDALAITKDSPRAGPLAIAQGVHSLAAVLYMTRRYAEAEPLWREALSIRKGILPAGHPVIAMSLNDLGNVFAATNRIDEAEIFYREARAILKVGLPAGHPDKAQNTYDLAQLLFAKGCGDEAEDLYREAAAIWKAALPGGHPKIANCLNRLAKLCYGACRDEEAESFLRDALAICKASLPAEHPQIAENLDNLAQLLCVKGDKDEAEPLYREALAIRKASLPAEHPQIAKNLDNLAQLLSSKGNNDGAEPLYREALALRQASLPTGHRDIAESVNNLASVLFDTDRYDEAEPLLRQALALFKTALPAGHPEIAVVCSNLATLLRNTGHYAEAESLYREALEILKSALPKGHSLTAQCLNGLARLLDTVDRVEDAEILRREAAGV